MELLEREGALAALADAAGAAARGRGGVVVVTGDPGMGKTALVSRFLSELPASTRALLGTCDDLGVPRPLGPLQDLVGEVRPELRDALTGEAGPDAVPRLVLEELAEGPTVLVLEDVHWADAATIDCVTVVGRRISQVPALLVLTFRDGEVPAGHPLRAAVGALRAEDVQWIELQPLSLSAVAVLSGDEAADAVLEATGGNAFYVTELAASEDRHAVPPSVAHAVLGRAAKLADDSRELLELVSVVPNRAPAALLDALRPGWVDVAEEPERRGLLEIDARAVRFRHELARHAVRDRLSAAARRKLHAEVLDHLLQTGADPADIVHHAEHAGEEEVVAASALDAARKARALGANAEAYAHFARAAEVAGHHPLPVRAAIFEELAMAAYVAGHNDAALPAIRHAAALYADAGDEEAVGRCAQQRSRLHWYAGDGDAALNAAEDAIVTLEAAGSTLELGRAYGALAQLEGLRGDPAAGRRYAQRALDLTDAHDDDAAKVHAEITLATADAALSPDGSGGFEALHRRASEAGAHHEATRALGNLAWSLATWVRPQESAAAIRRSIAYAQEHEVFALIPYARGLEAWLQLRAGDWDAADVLAEQVATAKGPSIATLYGRTVLAERAVRRGDEDAQDRLKIVRDEAEATGELQRIVPVIEMATEYALLSGSEPPVTRLQALVDGARDRPFDQYTQRIAAMAATAGLEVEAHDEGPPEAFAAVARRDWLTAATAFAQVGWRYDQALALSHTTDEATLGQALTLARELGAAPLTARVQRRLKELGLRAPSAPRRSTQANPAGLTTRQLEVVRLLVEGRTNSEIAERLVVSPRTAEHHVAAVLGKLGAATRHEAAARAAELGI